MAVGLKTIELELRDLLEPEQFNDYCPNGLQVQGVDQVKKLVTGVTASMALIEAAIAQDADLIFVHHGYFWKGEAQPITGIKRERIHALLTNNISLVAYHLPLDVHPELGNNAQLGKLLDLEVTGSFGNYQQHLLGLTGRTQAPIDAEDFNNLLASRLDRVPLSIKGSSAKISSVAWCTGAAQSYIEQAIEAGVDAYITGEVSEPTVHIARESGIHFFAAGHHATERYGVQAVGKYLAEKFSLDHCFIDIDNPV
jgi:dinuclear metal center YbgI/SA1388 family protein